MSNTQSQFDDISFQMRFTIFPLITPFVKDYIYIHPHNIYGWIHKLGEIKYSVRQWSQLNSHAGWLHHNNIGSYIKQVCITSIQHENDLQLSFSCKRIIWKYYRREIEILVVVSIKFIVFFFLNTLIKK